MYGQGEGVPGDLVRGYAWLSIVAAQGDTDGEKNKNNFAQRMTPAQIADGQKSSSELWEKYVVPFREE